MAEVETKKITPGKEIPKNEKVGKVKKAKSVLNVPNLYWRLAVAAVLGLILTGGIFFSNHKLKALAKDAEQKKGQLVALSQKDENFKQLSSALTSLSEEIGLLQKALPSEEGVVEFINQIENIKQTTEVEIKTFKFSDDLPKPDGGGNYYLELIIEAGGPLANLEKFSESLWQLPFLLKIKNQVINKMDEPTSEMILKIWLYVDPNFFQVIGNEKK